MDQISFEIFESLPRQGPGNEASTEKAFQTFKGLPERPEILDVGCGSGSQTLVLAELTPGNITALDNHAPFVEILERAVQEAGHAGRVKCVIGDMESMDFHDGSFDLIWSEGAAYIMGFREALDAWKRLLRPNGYIAASELVWFKQPAPQEIADYFKEGYPDMKHYQEIYPVVESAGYKVIDYFPLPDASWWTDYYTPARKKIAEMRRKYPGEDAQEVFDSFQREMDMHSRYFQYYGYGFYIMQKA